MKKEQSETKTTAKLITTFHYHSQIVSCQVTEQELTGQLSDGRKVSIPLTWFTQWGFKNFRPEQLKQYEIWEGGQIIFFPALNEPLHVRVFTDGFKAPCCC